MATLLLVDATFLCYRAFHSTGDLQYEGTSTGVSFGVLRDIEIIETLYSPNFVVWAFDSRSSKRKELYPNYKANRRKELTEEEWLEHNDFYSQLEGLKTAILPDLGYSNIIEIMGYEADDIIAIAARDLAVCDDAVIVTADKDLWQCLSDNVIWYNPTRKSKVVVTNLSFFFEWGIEPRQWAEVKSVAGCSSDNVEGVKGVGDKTAAKYVSGHLDIKSKKGKDIVDFVQTEEFDRNKRLVTLPFDDLKLDLAIKNDELLPSRRAKVHRSLGIRSDRRKSYMRGRNRKLGFDL